MKYQDECFIVGSVFQLVQIGRHLYSSSNNRIYFSSISNGKGNHLLFSASQVDCWEEKSSQPQRYIHTQGLCFLYTVHNVTISGREVPARVIDGLMPSFLEQHKNGYLSF